MMSSVVFWSNAPVTPVPASAATAGSVTARSRRVPDCVPPGGVSHPRLGDDPAVVDRIQESVIVPLVLIGIDLGERTDGVVEDLARPEGSGDGDPVTRSGVGPGEGPAAEPAIGGHALRYHLISVGRALPIAQLTDVEVP